MSLENITRMSRIFYFAKFNVLVLVVGNNWAENETAATFSRLYQNINNNLLRRKPIKKQNDYRLCISTSYNHCIHSSFKVLPHFLAQNLNFNVVMS